MCELWCCEATCNCDDPVLKKHNFSVLHSNTVKKSIKSTKMTQKHQFLQLMLDLQVLIPHILENNYQII